QRVVFTAEVFAQGIEEDLIVRRGVRKERHGRPEFEVIRVTEDLLDVAARDLIHQPRALAQPRTQNGMLQVGFSLGVRGDGEVSSRGAVAQSLDLRKHEPHPVGGLASGTKLREDLPDDGLLRVDETVEIQTLAIRLTRGSPPAGLRGERAWSASIAPR